MATATMMIPEEMFILFFLNATRRFLFLPRVLAEIASCLKILSVLLYGFLMIIFQRNKYRKIPLFT